MTDRYSKLNFSLAAALLLAFLSGCASKTPAPVEDRSQSLKSSAAQTGPGFHVVKKGETLYSISLEYGQDYREVAAWNYITDPNRISVGQSLRVMPPEGSAQAQPVVAATAVGGAVVEQRSLDGTTPQNSSQYKQSPKVQKEPYSDAAYARLQNPGAQPVEVAKTEAKATAPVAATTTAGAGESSVEGVVWSWPAQGKVVGTFAQGKGVDIAGKAGDPILASADGKVVYSGSGLRGYGQLVIVKHDATFLSAYAHNQKILVQEGQSVKRGQKIAEMGNTDSDTVKLHFEVRRQGKPVEPLDFLPKR